jgi:RHS repeat-associated protein
MNEESKAGKLEEGEKRSSAPSISLPKGGGAIRGIGEKFAANPVTGTGSLSVPIATSPGRPGFGPQLSLTYDSGSGNGPFGFGWNLSLPSITRKTEKGLPKYQDGDQSDTFILSGAEDLVPVLKQQDNDWVPEDVPDRTIGTDTYQIQRYRPRIEGLFARIERWTNTQSNETHWRSISRDNITTVYGRTTDSRIEDPDAPDGFPRVFSWLICESYDDKGNAIYYEYEPEDSAGIDLSQTNERNRTDKSLSANRYLKRIKYGNKTPVEHHSDLPREFREDLSERTDWLFEVVFDYEEGHYEELPADPNAHQFVKARIDPAQDWQSRQDPFSSYRSGFEVRTYRRCHRVLMFHHFPDELGVDDYLVRSTGFEYKEGPIASFIISVTQSGYVHKPSQTHPNRYLKKSLPPLEFEYSKATIQNKVQDVDEESIENLPQGLDGAQYQWADIDGEGSSGILTEQGDSWFYRRNVSALPVIGEDGNPHTVARFAPTERLAEVPSFTNLSEGRQQLLDLAGDGQLDVVEFDSPTPGFFERTKDETWHTFKPFVSLPNISWQDPNLKFLDLTGDGHADIFITEDEAFTWYRSLAEVGFASGERVRQALDEEKGPKLVFADGTQSIYLADISGDGLTDLVRIRNGEVCYWPNLGYGRFGAKVTMDNSPHFDTPDQFDQRHIRLADIDGSGVTDIIYLKGDGIYIYLNESGNRWADAEKLKSFPPIDNLSSVMALDLLGNGTACLVWSSPLPGHARKPMRYIDLMGGQKPHLLVKTVNNLGAETHVHYASSTRFYLADKLAGKPWITKIPFPVHVVERVETYDRISRNRFVTRYVYHHGYFDGIEREFRGFGMVEQWDTEEYETLKKSDDFPNATNIDKASHVPSVLTRTWFHTGAYLGRNHISNFFAGLLDVNDIGEYYREPGLTDAQARELLLEDTVLPAGLTVDEEREACRALKGSMLRQEVYALDGTGKEQHPYTVTEQNFTIRRLQPKEGNRHSVFFTHAREAINYNYERNPIDPRIAHAMTLEVDDFGNVLKEAAIGYGRRQPDMNLSAEDQAKQTQILVTYTENRVTNAIEAADDDYRTPLPCETRTYELTGYPSTGAAGRFQISDFVQPDPTDPSGRKRIHTFDGEVDYEDAPPNGRQRRLIEHLRRFYRPDDLGVSLNDPLALLPLETVESLALPGETYKLAFTPGLLAQVYQLPREGQPPENLLPNPNDILPVNLPAGQIADRGGYVDLDSDGHWWIPTGRVFYSSNSGDTAAQELTHARQHFVLPQRYRDPFGQTATISYDTYDLLMVETRDPLGSRVTVGERDATGNVTAPGNDYRVLQPTLVTDPNRNRSAVAFDALGMVVGTAVMGKTEENLGDSLAGFEADLTDSVILQHLANPLTDPHAILHRATMRLVYDLFAYHRTKEQPEPQPAVVYTLACETHDAYLDHDAGEQTRIQHSFSYSDGFEREIQKNIQAEPGPLVNGGSDIDPRWIVSGWTIFNNKGKPVRQYEPFFSDTHDFEFAKTVGVSPVLFYDPAERVVATLHPNHTWEKVVFDPWRQDSWDVSDTVMAADPKNDPDAGNFFRRLPDADYLLTWYAQREGGALGPQEQTAARKAAIHSDTPTIAHFDSLGRGFLTVAHNKFKRSDTPPADPPTEEFYRTRVIFDIEGNQREVIDAKDRVVMRYDYDMLGNRIHQASMEAGERWMLNDISGNPIRAWDSRNHRFRTAYDPLRRPTESYLREGAGPERLVGRTICGETWPNPEASNLRGQVVQLFDQAGVVTSDDYDFKGNLLSSQRQLAQEYKTTLDWSTAVPMEAPIYTSRTRYDALNRPIQLIAPHSDQPGTKINVIQPIYNEANLLEQVNVWLNQNAEPTDLLDPATANLNAVTDIDYDANGYRTLIDYGNGVRTTYEYDPLTFRLAHLLTRRNAPDFPGDCPQSPPAGWPGCQVQNLHYTYDPVGNITHIRDDAQQTIYFKNKRVEPSAEYTYDALYWLIEATGREHLGQVGGAPIPHSYNDSPRAGIVNPGLAGRFNPGDGNAMGTYLQQYVYDEVGNFLKMIHRGTDPAHPGWTHAYTYNETSQIEPAKRNNRLTSTTVGATQGTYSVNGDGYDLHGNMLKMPQLQVMQWDFKDQLLMSQHQAVNAQDDEGQQRQGERTYYVYDATGQRVRKVTELANGNPKDERIYLGGFEIYRKHTGANAGLVRETLHIMDDKQRIALVETRTQGNDPAPPQLIRYQFSNHLGSASLELDDQAQIISYEEYTPYGSTSYQAVRSQTETPKRYRYTGKERDEESGLYYNGARYYAAWLGRWTSADPAELVDGTNCYQYVQSNPVRLKDPNGLYSWGEFFEDVGSGIAGAARGIVEPAVIVMDFGQMGAALVTHAVTGDPDDLNVHFLSMTGQRIAASPDPESTGLRAGAVLVTAIPTGGASVLVDNVATVFENDMSPDEARRHLVRGAVGQVAATGVGMGLSRATGSGWTGRGSSAGDQALTQRIVSERAANGETSTGRGGPSSRTYAVGRDARGRTTPVRRSPSEGGDPHAEPQALEDVGSLGGRTIMVDQVPCSSCRSQLGAPESAQPGFLDSSTLGSLRVVTPRRASNPTSSPKSATIRAARAIEQGMPNIELTPNLEFTVPFAPPTVQYQSAYPMSMDPSIPTQAEIEAQQCLPEPYRYY